MLLPAAMAATLSTSRPAQKAEPSPESTTARKLRSSLSLAPASAIARNIAGSRAFILSARLSRTSAMPSAIFHGTISFLLLLRTRRAWLHGATPAELGRGERSKTKRGAHVEPGEWAAQAKRAEELAIAQGDRQAKITQHCDHRESNTRCLRRPARALSDAIRTAQA